MLGILRYLLRHVSRPPATTAGSNIKAQATNRNPFLPFALNPQGLRVFALRYNNANKRTPPIKLENRNGDYQLDLTDLLKLCSWNKTFATLMLEGCLQRLPKASQSIDFVFDNEQEIEKRFAAIFSANKQHFTVMRAPNGDDQSIYFWLAYRIVTRFPGLAFTTLTQTNHWEKFNNHLSKYLSLQKNFAEITHSAFELYDRVSAHFHLKPQDLAYFYLAQTDNKINDYTQRLFYPESYNELKREQLDLGKLKQELLQQKNMDKWLIVKKAFHWFTGGRLFRAEIIRHTAIRLLESCVNSKLNENKQKEKDTSSVYMDFSSTSSCVSSFSKFTENGNQTPTYPRPATAFYIYPPMFKQRESEVPDNESDGKTVFADYVSEYSSESMYIE